MQDTQNPRKSVFVSFGEGGTVYGCGHTLDTLLYAHGLSTEIDQHEYTADYEWETMCQILKEWDFEGPTLDRLNRLSVGVFLEELATKHISVTTFSTLEIEASPYLPGDWLRFNHPDTFKRIAKEDEETIEEIVREEIGEWNSAHIPADLKKALIKNIEWAQENAHEEWLHGDRSNDGALRTLLKEMFGRYTAGDITWGYDKWTAEGSRGDWVRIDTTEEEWREWLGYDLDEREPLPEPAQLAETVKKRTLQMAETLREKNMAASEKRMQDYRETQRREEERLEQEKEEARQRKIKNSRA